MCLNDEIKLTFMGEVKKNEKILDALNLDAPYEGEEIQEWKDRMRELVCKSCIQLPADMDEELFNFMDDYDIEKYILNRFGGKSRTIEKTYFYKCGSRTAGYLAGRDDGFPVGTL